MSKLLLHIGHPKTGSTAIQVACARSASQLADEGIVYPDHVSTELALAGHFAGGNVTRNHLIGSYEKVQSAVGPNKSIFYSCEGLFDDLAEPSCQIAELKNIGTDISVLMFVRNPVEYALSFYQQKIKEGVYTGSADDFLSEFEQVGQTEIVLNHLDTLAIPLTLHSFDDKRDQVIELTELWLGVPELTLERLDGTTVNRSPTRAEQTFLGGLSARLGPSGSDHIGHALVNELPDIASELPSLSKTGYLNFVTRIEPHYRRVKKRLPKDVRYEITPYETLYPTEPLVDHYVFSQAQIDVITKALATRAPDAEFAKEYIRWVKETKEGDVLSAEDIFRINRLGQILRPGNFPQQRMQRLKQRVGTKKT